MRKLAMLTMLGSTLMAIHALPANALPIIAIDADPSTPGVQSFREIHDYGNITVNVDVFGLSSSEGLGGFQFDLAYDPGILTPIAINSANSLPGPTLSSSSLHPEITFAETSLSSFGPFPTGNLHLASITFLAFASGISALDLNDSILSDEFGFAIAHNEADAAIKVSTPPTIGLFAIGLFSLCFGWRRQRGLV